MLGLLKVRNILFVFLMTFTFGAAADASMGKSCIRYIKKTCSAKKYSSLQKRIKCSKLLNSNLSSDCQQINKKWINLLMSKQNPGTKFKKFVRKYKFWVVMLMLMLSASFIGLFMIFIKAGYEGMHAFIPFYNATILMKICALPANWGILLMTPLGIFIWPRVADALSESFGQDDFFSKKLMVLPFIYLIVLGFSERIQYQGRGKMPSISFDIKF